MKLSTHNGKIILYPLRNQILQKNTTIKSNTQNLSQVLGEFTLEECQMKKVESELFIGISKVRFKSSKNQSLSGKLNLRLQVFRSQGNKLQSKTINLITQLQQHKLIEDSNLMHV